MKKYRLKLRMKGTDFYLRYVQRKAYNLLLLNENGEIHYWYFAAMLFYPYGDRGAMYCAFGEHGADVALRRSALD